MFEHKKKLLHPVKVERPNPQYAVLMQEQLGGCNGEVKAAMQYLSQSFRAKDPVFKDLFLDIGTEELSHMEMVAETINLLNGGDVDYKKVDAGEIETMVTFGLNPALVNSSGNPWTADYVTVTGDLAADLLADIASEQRAKVVYEYLYRQIDDKSTHNRRERPVCGHRGRSRGPFYYRITTFGKGPWDARDPHKTTFMALKHVIRLSIWQRQKETPGVEKAPGVSSPQRKESGRSGRDDGELRFGYDPAIHARRLRVYHRPRRLRMASRISIFFAARRFEPLNSMG